MGADPDRGPEASSGVPPARDPRLALFAGDGSQGELAPSGRLALFADELCGPGRRCPGATDNELVGLLRAWAALESWASSAKLAVVAELIRRDDIPGSNGRHGDLPDAWSASLRHELAGALACSAQSAETTAWLAWEQQARLPGIGALLHDGTLTAAKARAVIETFRYLSDADAARAEALIRDQLAGKTYMQVLRLAEQAALNVDPELAERRREQAQKRDARVTFLRELSGTAALSGRDLPPDEALAAMASVNARAQEYEDSGAFGDTRMDVLRAQAYLDLLNGVAADDRIACAEPQDEAAEAAEALAWAESRAAARTADARTDTGTGGEPEADTGATATDAGAPGTADGVDGDSQADLPGCSGVECEGSCDDPARERDGDDSEGGDGEDDGDEDEGGDGEPGGDHGPDSGGPASWPGGPLAGRVLQRRPADLVVPLATLLGLAERPGEIQGFGLVDPALAREMAAAAVVSSHTEVCVTVTSPEGYAIGHGCARPQRTQRELRKTDASLAGLPARLNLTIPAAALPNLPRSTCHGGQWAFSWRGSPGTPAGTDPPDDYGSWSLVLPGGRQFTVRLDPVPTFKCDHRYESHGYQPGDKLRHLVQVRDGTCTFPSCNRAARDCDFEHALPYDQGGRTCCCNAGARSRACHRVKQSKGWRVSQPRPGWHQWQTPAGRIYTQEPWRYPA